MSRAHNAVSHSPAPRSDLAELGNILQKLAALGDREWIEDVLVLARKRLATVRHSLADAADPDTKREPD